MINDFVSLSCIHVTETHAQRAVSIPQRVLFFFTELCTPVKTIKICRGFHERCSQFREYDSIMATMMVRLSLTTASQGKGFVYWSSAEESDSP